MIIAILIITTYLFFNSKKGEVQNKYMQYINILKTYLLVLVGIQVLIGSSAVYGHRIQFLGYYTSEIVHIINIISIWLGIGIILYTSWKEGQKKISLKAVLVALAIVLSMLLVRLPFDYASLMAIPRYEQFYQGSMASMRIDQHTSENTLTEISFYDKSGKLVGYQYQIDKPMDAPNVSYGYFLDNTLYIGDFEWIELDKEDTGDVFIHFTDYELDVDKMIILERGKKYKFKDLEPSW